MVDKAPFWSLRSVVISVKNLDLSSIFYQDILNIYEVLREDQVAVLGGDSGQSTLFLREEPRNAVRHGQETLGLRSVTFNVKTIAELDRIDARLRALDGFRERHRMDETGNLEVLDGHDPDRFPLTFLALAGGQQVSLDNYHRRLAQIYALDL